jgi:Cys-tRNA(Pro)/Cys-tRNA(Cys) deacylase
MAKKLNSMRLLDREGVHYDVFEFPDTIHAAQGVAEYARVAMSDVYKTLVLITAKTTPILIMVPADHDLQVKRRLARVLGDKKLRMATHKEAEAVTGLKVGGISALALRHRRFPVYLAHTAANLNHLLVSAGQRGVDLRLRVADLIRVTGATLVDATVPIEPESGQPLMSNQQ